MSDWAFCVNDDPHYPHDRCPGAQAPLGDLPRAHKSWAHKHVAENPSHRTREGLNEPGSCCDCAERSPIYDLRARPATKPPQRPHHWMNADGTCHAGELFETGTPAIPLYTFEQMEAWVRAERQAVEQSSAADQPCDRCAFIPTPGGACICREVAE